MYDFIVVVQTEFQGGNVQVDDFIVVVQIEFQRHLIQKFVSKEMCCDSTHGATGKKSHYT